MRDRLIDILNSIQDYGTKVTDKKDEHYGKYTEEEKAYDVHYTLQQQR